MYFQKIPRHSNIIHNQPIRLMLQCLTPDTRNVWTEHGAIISVTEVLIGKLYIMLLITMDLKSLLDVWPIITWDLQVILAADIYIPVNTSKFTVWFVQRSRLVVSWSHCDEYLAVVLQLLGTSCLCYKNDCITKL